MSDPAASTSRSPIQPDIDQGIEVSHSVTELTTSNEDENFERENVIRNSRKRLRGRFTRAVNRVKVAIETEVKDERRLSKEIGEVRNLCHEATDVHAELYDVVQEHSPLDKWEADLMGELYSIELQTEDYIKKLKFSGSESVKKDKRRVITRSVASNQEQLVYSNENTNLNITQGHEGQGQIENQNFMFDTGVDNLVTNQELVRTPVPSLPKSNVHSVRTDNNVSDLPFDYWVDNLVEFSETNIVSQNQNMSVAEALYKLEASRDIPSIQISKFDGSPLQYVEFIEGFKVHIHNKPHLTDDMRMIQLRMHVTGDAERAISGLGSGGMMYATAMKLIKDQFGQKTVIARALINKLTKGGKIASNDRHALREFSLDIINALAAFHQIKHFADANANDSLRQIIRRLSDNLIQAWKVRVTELRDKGRQPTLEEISAFIRKRVKTEFDPDFGDLISAGAGSGKSYDNKSFLKDRKRGVHSTQPDTPKKVCKCFICQEPHRVLDCPTLANSTVDQRVQLVKSNRLCFSCLMKGHSSYDCRSKKQCNKNGCTKSHHPFLHYNPPPLASGTSAALDNDCIMPVVRVLFRAANGKCREGNVLIDSGAGTTIIRKEFSKALGLQGKREGLDISVVGGKCLEQPNSRRVKFWVQGLNGGEEFPIEAHEIDRTILNVPALNKPWLKSFIHLKDVELSHKAGPVDLILGVQFSHLHTEEEIRQGLHFEPVAKKTRLGWYVIGSDKAKRSTISSVNFVQKIDFDKFYRFETMGIQQPDCSCPVSIMSREDKKAMELMESSCKKDGDRYIIGLPWRSDPRSLPNNYPLAEKRLVSLERNLKKDPARAKMYDDAIMEYERRGWACLLTAAEAEKTYTSVYYLPHHGVYRPDKASTPLRVVFDPACQYQGVSLNSFLFKGPCLIGNLLGVLLRFREDHVAFSGDIAKMFLQIHLPEPDSHVHRFLWRNLDSSRDPDIYRLLRVTFGDKPSPDMASFVILKLADDNQQEFPEAATILKRDRYVDDLIHSCSSVDEAFQRMGELDKILSSGSFQIKKWFCSAVSYDKQNSDSDQINIDDTPCAARPVTEINLDGEDIKTLGVCWNPASDVIKFRVRDMTPEKLTKRSILSKISMIYDPLGLATVVTVVARIAMQDLWRSKLDWDDELPSDVCRLWHVIFKELQKLDGVEFPRCLKAKDARSEAELHVFSDASGKAYGAAAYLLWPTEYGAEIRLVAAKSRVAPLKQTTIPRLELMAALIGSRLSKTLCDELKLKSTSVTLWTDSQIVLHWLKSESITLKAFVGVRVAEIQTTLDPGNCRFIPTQLNPADDLTRGISADEIQGRWANGPEFLRRPKDEWPKDMAHPVYNDTEVKQPKPLFIVQKHNPCLDPSIFSSWNRLVRVTAYCFRFVKNLKLKSSSTDSSKALQPSEIAESEKYWIKIAQQNLVDWEKRYRDLAPSIEDGVIRVGGRLRNSPLQYDQNHPVLLPADHAISKLVMFNSHTKMGHTGSERTLSECRRKYWIIRGRNLAKGITRKCVVCRKLNQRPHSTVMADLPMERLKPFSPPFFVTGVDLFGPFLMKYGRNKSVKAWGAVFTCATTRAIHLEIVADASTSAFLHALRRFAAHHGWPNTMISDNGSNFIGARAELRKLVEKNSQLQEFASSHLIKWNFITPLSPHQGGFYESLVKQTKRALQVAIGQQLLSWNEMSTAFAEVKCLLNSRPLGYTPNNPNDPQPVTPNHFILGRASVVIPQGPFEETRNLHKRFEQVQMIVTQFWKRFIRDYFPTLMRRAKWQLKGRQLQVGDVVLLTDPDVKRGKWNLARVIEVYPGNDGVVRNVKIKTKHGEYRRSIQCCCPLLEADVGPVVGPGGCLESANSDKRPTTLDVRDDTARATVATPTD